MGSVLMIVNFTADLIILMTVTLIVVIRITIVSIMIIIVNNLGFVLGLVSGLRFGLGPWVLSLTDRRPYQRHHFALIRLRRFRRLGRGQSFRDIGPPPVKTPVSLRVVHIST